MRIKALLTSILLASTTIAGVASASPIVRDHRTEQTVTYRAPARAQASIQVQTRPSWLVNASANVNYGFQVDRDGDSVQPYRYGQDPYVEGIARGEWFTLGSNLQLKGNGNGGEIIDLGGRPMTSLEIQNMAGCSEVTKVAVLLSNGSSIAITPQRTLDSHEPNLRLDLGAKARVGVNRVIVYGSGTGTFRILGA